MNCLSPSILSADFSRLGEQIRELDEAGAQYVHIDVMDGNFVLNLSINSQFLSLSANYNRRQWHLHQSFPLPSTAPRLSK